MIKKFLLFALCSLVPLLSAEAAITRVQTVTASTGASNALSTLTVTLGSAPTAGNIVVIALATNGAPFSHITEAAGYTWSYFPAARSTSDLYVTLAVARIGAGAGTGITITIPTSNPMAVIAAEYSGTNIRVDQTMSTVPTVGGTAIATGATPTTTNANELWLGALGCRGLNAVTFSAPTNGFSIVGQTGTTVNLTNADRSVALLEQFVTSTGTANAGATISQSGFWGAVVGTFEELATTTSGIPSIGL